MFGHQTPVFGVAYISETQQRPGQGLGGPGRWVLFCPGRELCPRTHASCTDLHPALFNNVTDSCDSYSKHSLFSVPSLPIAQRTRGRFTSQRPDWGTACLATATAGPHSYTVLQREPQGTCLLLSQRVGRWLLPAAGLYQLRGLRRIEK